MAPLSPLTLHRPMPQPMLRPLTNTPAVRFGDVTVKESETPDSGQPVDRAQDPPVEAPTIKQPEAPAPEAKVPEAKAKAVPKKGIIGRTRDLFSSIRTSWSAFKDFIKSDNVTVAKGLFFKKGIPLLFSLGAFVPVWGIAIGLVGLPLSYFSGRYGDRVLTQLKEKKDVDLSESMKHIHRIDELLDSKDKAKSDTELVDTINKLIDDALDVSKFPGLQKLVNLIRPTPTNLMGRLIKNYQQFAFMANVNTAVAEAKTPGEAVWKGVKGGFSYIFYFKIMFNLGKAIEKGANFAPGPLKYIFKFIGWAMEYAGLIKMAADTVLPGATPEPKKA